MNFFIDYLYIMKDGKLNSEISLKENKTNNLQNVYHVIYTVKNKSTGCFKKK